MLRFHQVTVTALFAAAVLATGAQAKVIRVNDLTTSPA